jgi:hypothetical protein
LYITHVGCHTNLPLSNSNLFSILSKKFP